MMVNERKNYLKAVHFERPEYIPMKFGISPACFQHYPQDQLFELMETHQFLFPNFIRPTGKFEPVYSPIAQKNQPFTDDFGCLWQTAEEGITGTVIGHPLADWQNFQSYRVPDPEKCMGLGPVNWEKIRAAVERSRDEGKIAQGSLTHGHTFLRLCDIRGYQNLIYDMVDDEPNLGKLIRMVEAFNRVIVEKYVDMDVDVFAYPEDLGMQKGPMLSPEHFRKYIKPSYQRLMKPARDKGIIVHMHSDGDIRDLADDLIDGGVDVINLQDLVNGIDWITSRFAGKICVDLDIDRQFITARGTEAQIDALILEEIKKIGRKEGGLTMIYGLYPGVPLQNVKALMDAMEKYAFYYQ